MPVTSIFNILPFGNEFKSFSETSVQYDAATLKKALTWISGLDANMGGTNISKPMKFLEGVPVKPEYPRNVFLLTDGAVVDSSKVIDIVKKNAFTTRVHTFGIGSGASRYLVKSCAIFGNGDFQFTTEAEDITPKVMASL